ncbi:MULTISPECIES: amino acid ABC transporter permease [Bosea]|uniref:amino acid ABC transporter permease n=1 Tax=Bosea TaxID=85413 RepID=UPI00214FDF46|nr:MULTISPECIES: amino acid ABC transporter permease [Bosea]MCR4521954.1 amino acid ABC transporter permease [Bosea sp. 47.2.35]MDR6829569.1 general L-amino acid transport system permease protein [Bosea robiniae]MDR6896452.1 general L-amino acid transport system permease protein [Bosea sp. BE109]MDR7139850.1 general L-amino acid transport system permease protein [Bosea sp. BE168]MDR7176428.1 general L-amino acid transport system permease protein [Bosea sp. BE271]
MTRTSALSIWRERLFATPFTGFTSVVLVVLMAWIAVPLIRWAVIDATWVGSTRADCAAGGACWVFIRARFGQFMYGLYPVDQRWRVDIAGILVLASVLAVVFAPQRFKLKLALALLVVLPPLGIWLLSGGFGLRHVETREWGGLTLTLFISIYSSLIAIPLGIIFALGRQSELRIIRLISVIFIEFWRGVPIIAVIFLASLLLPLILPGGIGIDRLARAVIGLGFVIAAYMAEAVRGGLQALPKGQREAATALGLNYWKATGLIVLPQALRISLPAMTNEFIALIKNTTLVLVVSILDLLGIAQASLADPNWVGMNMEAYAFSGAIYWLICFALSRWSRSLEKKRRL